MSESKEQNIMTEIQEMYERRGYATEANFGENVVIMSKEGKFIKIDEDGFVVPFKPIFE